MKTGLLWYSGSKTKTFTEKALEAVEYYHKKYGRPPEMCVVNPKNLPLEQNDRILEFKGWKIPVTAEKYVLADCFFICVEISNLEEQPKQQPKPESAVEQFIRHAQKVTS